MLKPKNVHSCAQPKIYGKKTVLAAQAVLNFEPKELAQLLPRPLWPLCKYAGEQSGNPKAIDNFSKPGAMMFGHFGM